LAKYARANDLQHHLGKFFYPLFHRMLTKIIFLFLVQEIKYEKVLASTDGIDIKSSKEFSFVITPSTDYFTT
jgi:hypothetical protein